RGAPSASRRRTRRRPRSCARQEVARSSSSTARRQPACTPDRSRGSAHMPETHRRVVDVRRDPFLPYDMEGPEQEDITWLPVSWDDASGQGSYLMRMEPGARTLAHAHRGFEEFLVVEGTLTDSDGTVFRPGEFVSYRGGVHHSWTDTGCVLAV